MTLYELIFILLFIGSVINLVAVALLWRTGRARRILVALASVWGVYLTILAVTDVLCSQKVFMVGEDQCFDEMCFAVVDAQLIPKQASNASPGNLCMVKIRVTNHSRGRTQAEGGLRGRLYDGGTYINISEAAEQAYGEEHGESPRLTQKVAPGESIVSILVFELPKTFEHPALTLDHGFTSGYFILGESPFFHKPDLHMLSGCL